MHYLGAIGPTIFYYTRWLNVISVIHPAAGNNYLVMHTNVTLSCLMKQ